MVRDPQDHDISRKEIADLGQERGHHARRDREPSPRSGWPGRPDGARASPRRARRRGRAGELAPMYQSASGPHLPEPHGTSGWVAGLKCAPDCIPQGE